MNYSILINTCDKFDDCWEPYFKLHAKFWPDCAGRLYLNTEYKDYSYPSLDVVALKVCESKKDAHRITWSECLIRALDAMPEDIVLYMQEDYFFKAPVKNEIVERFVQLMHDHKDIDCIHLTDQAVLSDGPSEYDGLHLVTQKQRYRVGCQAALWRKNVLRSYLRTYESAWQFEEFGSKRGAILKHKFLVVDPNWVKLNVFEIIPYIFTGVIQGRWFEEVVPLFAEHGIAVDYAKRGFVKDAPARPFSLKLKAYWRRIPVLVRSSLELWNLKAISR